MDTESLSEYFNAEESRNTALVTIEFDGSEGFAGFGRAYAQAYAQMGDVSYGAWKSGTGSRDFGFFPALFMYRHALECLFKTVNECCALLGHDIGRTVVIEDSSHDRHDLQGLLRDFRRSMKALGQGTTWPRHSEDSASSEELAEAVAALHEIDPNSYSFRYPCTKEGSASIRPGRGVRVAHLADRLRRCINTLDTIVFGLGYARREDREIKVRMAGSSEELDWILSERDDVRRHRRSAQATAPQDTTNSDGVG